MARIFHAVKIKLIKDGHTPGGPIPSGTILKGSIKKDGFAVAWILEPYFWLDCPPGSWVPA